MAEAVAIIYAHPFWTMAFIVLMFNLRVSFK